MEKSEVKVEHSGYDRVKQLENWLNEALKVESLRTVSGFDNANTLLNDCKAAVKKYNSENGIGWGKKKKDPKV